MLRLVKIEQTCLDEAWRNSVSVKEDYQATFPKDNQTIYHQKKAG